MASKTLEEALLDRVIDEVEDVARTLRFTADKIERQEMFRTSDGMADFAAYALNLMHTLDNMNAEARSVVRTCFEAVRALSTTPDSVQRPGSAPVT